MIWKLTRQSYKNKQDPEQRQLKQSDLEMLELAAAAGEIELKYLDESGFCMWSPVSYTYFPRGQQKRLEQTKAERSETEYFRANPTPGQFCLRSSYWGIYQ